jgi:hypothetical protein
MQMERLQDGLVLSRSAKVTENYAWVPSKEESGNGGIGIEQADRAATWDTNSVIATAMDTNVDRPAITVCILLSAEDVFRD